MSATAVIGLQWGDEAKGKIVDLLTDEQVANFAAGNPGALIVVEREIGLRTYIEIGVPMDARVSYDLLVTIFRPSAPLHDGAVIIQRDRVAAAACFLPLTVNPRLGRDLGTRHRAAIGLTEENDAIAIVVSEERGQIGLAIDGGLERDLTPDQLRDRLRSLLIARRTRVRKPAAAVYDF